MESLRHAIERCAQTGGERERTLASTIFSHNGGVSCRENYDTVSSMQKKKKKREEKIKIKKKKPEPHTCRTPRCFVSRVSRDFHGKRIAAYIRETNMKKKRERGSSMITDDAKEERGGRKGRVAKS